MLEVIRQDYIRTARAKGLDERLTISRHALKNAIIPVVTIIGLQVGYLLGGDILIETGFLIPGHWPGDGQRHPGQGFSPGAGSAFSWWHPHTFWSIWR